MFLSGLILLALSVCIFTLLSIESKLKRIVAILEASSTSQKVEQGKTEPTSERSD